MHKARPVPVDVPTVSLRSLLDRKIGAADGDVGTIRDFYVDEATWTLRFLVADAAGWLPGQFRLFSRPCFGARPFGFSLAEVPRVTMTRLKIARGPAFDPGRGPSARDEAEHLRHYGLDAGPAERDGAGAMGSAPPRGFRSFLGGPVCVSEGEVGTLRDFIVEPVTWRILELVVGTGRWLAFREVRVGARDFAPGGRAGSAPGVKLTREELNNTPRGGLARAGGAKDD